MTVTGPALRARPDRRPSSSPRPQLRTVPARGGSSRSSRRSLRAFVVLSVFVALGSLLVVVAAHAYLTEGQVRLAQLQEQVKTQLDQQGNLELKVASLEQPSNVVSEAQKQGLVVPSKVQELSEVSVSTGSATSGTGTATSGG